MRVPARTRLVLSDGFAHVGDSSVVTASRSAGFEVLMELAVPKPISPPLTALIVEPLLPDALAAVSVLSTAGFHVTVAEGFGEARALLASTRPSLLLTEVQLSDYNGLHLVLHAKAIRPDMAAIVTARRPDASLQSEAGRLGATFIGMPTTEGELLAAVLRTVFRTPGDTSPITAPFERRRGERRSQTSVRVYEQRVGERRRGPERLEGSDERVARHQ